MTMTEDTQVAETPRLDPVALPLTGSRLIEASAGTGKTFTISALYLRLVLGHGEGDNAFSRELLPPPRTCAAKRAASTSASVALGASNAIATCICAVS